MTATRWLTTLLLASIATYGASAEERRGGLVLWDENLESALGRVILEREECVEYARSANTEEECAGVAGLPLREYERLTDLDRFVLFADKYANARFNRELSAGTELKFRADVPDVLNQQADFKLELDIDF